jgi:hypothetical protein
MKLRSTFFVAMLALIANNVSAADKNSPAAEKEIGSGTDSARQDSRAILENGQVFVEAGKDRKPLPLPAPARSIHQDGQTLYVALGALGVQVYLVSAQGVFLQRQLSLPQGHAVGFFTREDRLWVELQATNAVVLDESLGTNVAIASVSGGRSDSGSEFVAKEGGAKDEEKDKKKKKEKKEKKEKLLRPIKLREKAIGVVGVFHGTAKLDIGTVDGLNLKDRFEIYRKIEIKGGDESFEGEELAAMGEVVALNPDSCVVRLPKGDRVAKGDRAILVNKAIVLRNMIPGKLEKVAEVAFSAHPILNLEGSGGAGGLVEADLSWFGKHMYTAFRVKPMGFGWTSKDPVFNGTFLAEGGYDGRVFAVGLGVGIGVTNGVMDVDMEDQMAAGDENVSPAAPDNKVVFAMSQQLRVGPKDGLNITTYNTFLYVTSGISGEPQGFRWGSTTSKINVPLGYRVSLFTAGGAGRLGFGYGELGVFVWAKGNGDAGSIGVSGAIGAAGIWSNTGRFDEYGEQESVTLVGPSVSFGFVHRFGRSTQNR